MPLVAEHSYFAQDLLSPLGYRPGERIDELVGKNVPSVRSR